MNYSTWEKSRWHVYSYGGELDSQGRLTKDNDLISILHLGLDFKIIDILDDINKYIKIAVDTEEFKSEQKVTYKEKQELRKLLKKVGKDYIKYRLEKGFEHELFTVE